jgi:hypothetical protein
MEYQDMVRRVLERRPTRAITIFVDMKDVDCAVKKAQVCASASACYKDN